jgi:hypothetical protein
LENRRRSSSQDKPKDHQLPCFPPNHQSIPTVTLFCDPSQTFGLSVENGTLVKSRLYLSRV